MNGDHEGCLCRTCAVTKVSKEERRLCYLGFVCLIQVVFVRGCAEPWTFAV